MQSGSYVSCTSGSARSGDAKRLSDQAEVDGYSVYAIVVDNKKEPVDVWFVKPVRFPDRADVIYITRLFTAYEWNRLSAAFRIKLTATER